MLQINFTAASFNNRNKVLTLQYSRLGTKEAETQVEEISMMIGTRRPGLDKARQLAELIFPNRGEAGLEAAEFDSLADDTVKQFQAIGMQDEWLGKMLGSYQKIQTYYVPGETKRYFRQFCEFLTHVRIKLTRTDS